MNDSRTAAFPKAQPNTEGLTPAVLKDITPVTAQQKPAPLALAVALRNVSEAERAHDQAQQDENRARQALTAASINAAQTAQVVASSRRAYDEALQHDRRAHIDPAARPRAGM